MYKYFTLLLLIYFLCLQNKLSAVVFENIENQTSDSLKDKKLMSMTIEDLMNMKVETASKYEQTLNQAPASMSVITAEDIQRYGYQTLGEALNSLVGFYLTYDRNYYYAGIRGFSPPGDNNERFLILVDGHEINEDIYGTAGIGNDFGIDLNTVDRIEIVRGPGSAMYGTGAMFAVINIITKTPDNNNELMVNNTIGSYDTYTETGYYAKKFDNDLLVSISAKCGYSQGQNLFFKDYKDSTNHGIAQNLDGARYYDTYIKLAYKGLTFSGYINSSEKGIPTASWGMIFDKTGAESTDITRFTELKYKKDLDSTKKIMIRTYMDDYTYNGTFQYLPYPQYEQDNGIWAGVEGQFQWDCFKNDKFIAGTEYQNHFRDAVHQWAENTDFFSGNFPFNIFSVYLQDEYKLFNNLSIIAGARDAKYSTANNSVMPRFALIYNPVKSGTFKYLFGTGFRAPNINEMDYYMPGLQITNPNLKPEKIITHEIVYEQQILPELQANISAYYNRILEFVIPVTIPVEIYNPLTGDTLKQINQYQNSSEIDSKGIEFELQTKFKSGLQAYANFSFQTSKYKNSNNEIPNSPEQIVKAGIVCPLLKYFYLSAEANYQTGRITLYNTSTSSFFLANINLTTKSYHNISLSFKIYNLFNTYYAYPSDGPLIDQMDAIVQDGRNYLLSLKYKF